MELDMEAFQKVYMYHTKREAQKELQRFSTTAVAQGGDKKSVKKYLDPLVKIANYVAPDKSKGTEEKRANAGMKSLLKDFGSGF
jgi:hypothetical protein